MIGYFIRPASACKFLFINAFWLALSTGCATVPVLPAGDFELRGKVAVAEHDERFSARFIWRQRPDGFAMELWGPLGQGRIRLQGDPERLAIVDAHGQTVSQGPPDAVMREHLGWTLPLDALSHWARGTPTPDLPLGAQQYDAKGRLVAFEQLGWSIVCDGHQSVAGGSARRWLPGRVTAEKPGYRVRMVVSQWRL